MEDAQANLEYNQSLLQRADADKVDDINAKIEEFTELVTSLQRFVDNAEGALAQAAAAQAEAAAI